MRLISLQATLSVTLIILFVIFQEYNYITYSLTTLLFLGVILNIYLKDQKYSFTISYTLIALVLATIISIYLEYGVYLFEMRTTSYKTGLPLKISIQLILFFLSSYLIFYKLKKGSIQVIPLTAKSNQLIIIFTRLIMMGIITILVSIALKYGTPSSHLLHRNDYWTYIAPSWGMTLVYFLIQLNFLLGVNFSHKHKLIDLCLFIMSTICILLMGERFTGLIYLFLYFFLPVMINSNRKINLFKIMLLSIPFLLILFIALSSTYEKDKIGNIINRAAVQAQMWWGLEQLSDIDPKPLHIITDKYFGLNEPPRESGVYYLMDQVADRDIVDARYKTQSTFTLAGFMNNIYFFGYFFGSIINILWGLLFGVITYFFYIGIIYKNYIFSLISFKFFYKIWGITANGASTELLSINMFLYILLLLLFIKYKSKNENIIYN